MNISETERQKYERVWAEEENYRKANWGLKIWQQYSALFHGKSILDIGCGTGRLAGMLLEQGFEVGAVDIADNAIDPDLREVLKPYFTRTTLWDMDLGRMFDMGVCADVMEHLPEDKVIPSLERIKAHCRTVLFVIAGYPSTHKGIILHLTLKDGNWWQEQIASLGGAVAPLVYNRPDREKVWSFLWTI